MGMKKYQAQKEGGRTRSKITWEHEERWKKVSGTQRKAGEISRNEVGGKETQTKSISQR